MAVNSSTIATARRMPAGSHGTTFATLRQRLSLWQEQSRIRAELRCMTPRELADLGLNESDIDDVARGTFARP